MSVSYYLIVLVAIVAVVMISRVAQKRALAGVANLSPDQAQARINDFFGSSFNLDPDEKLQGVWISEEFQGVKGAGRQVAGAALNSLAGAAIGVSTYVPQVRVGLTTAGRVLFSREYSELGSRGNFKQVDAFEAGTQALDAASAFPGEALKPPMQSPLGGGAPPEFVQFRAPSGKTYEVWIAAGQTMGGPFVATFNALSGVAS